MNLSVGERANDDDCRAERKFACKLVQTKPAKHRKLSSGQAGSESVGLLHEQQLLVVVAVALLLLSLHRKCAFELFPLVVGCVCARRGGGRLQLPAVAGNCCPPLVCPATLLADCNTIAARYWRNKPVLGLELSSERVEARLF